MSRRVGSGMCTGGAPIFTQYFSAPFFDARGMPAFVDWHSAGWRKQ